MRKSSTDLHRLESDVIRLINGLEAFQQIINHHTAMYDKLRQEYDDLQEEHLRLYNSIEEKQKLHDEIVILLTQSLQKYESSK